MNETPNQNHSTHGTPADGGFKVHIDERDLMTGSFTPPQQQDQRGHQTAYHEPSAYAPTAGQPYLSEKDRKAEKKAHKKRNRIKARKNKRVFSLVWLCMVLLVGFTLASYLISGANDLFAVGRNEGTTEVAIPEEVDASSLADILYQRGAIAKPEFFELYARFTVGEWDLFEKGVYQVGTNLDYEDLINTLQGGNETREVVSVTFPEGSNALEIAQLMEEKEVCTAQEFLTALNQLDFTNYHVIEALGDTSGRYFAPEGYLFPDTYDFYKGEELESVIGKLINNFQEKMASATTTALVEQSGMSLDQIITIASMIQCEAADESDMYKVSAVLHNRLSFGAENDIFRLECDSTTSYPYKHMKDIPESGALPYGNYDTYQIEGLPPGPICNPGMDAINAALKPSTEGDAPDYLYFCHDADGNAYYATNSYDHEYNLELAGLLE